MQAAEKTNKNTKGPVRLSKRVHEELLRIQKKRENEFGRGPSIADLVDEVWDRDIQRVGGSFRDATANELKQLAALLGILRSGDEAQRDLVEIAAKIGGQTKKVDHASKEASETRDLHKRKRVG